LHKEFKNRKLNPSNQALANSQGIQEKNQYMSGYGSQQPDNSLGQ